MQMLINLCYNKIKSLHFFLNMGIHDALFNTKEYLPSFVMRRNKATTKLNLSQIKDAASAVFFISMKHSFSQSKSPFLTDREHNAAVLKRYINLHPFFPLSSAACIHRIKLDPPFGLGMQ